MSKRDVEKRRNILTCYNCDIVFSNDVDGFVNHMTDVHESDKIHCNYCSNIFASGLQYAYHFVQTHHSAPTSSNSSSTCSASSSSVSDVVDDSIICPLCPFQSPDSDEVMMHFMAKHEHEQCDITETSANFVNCPVCDVKITQEKADQHVNSHFNNEVLTSEATGTSIGQDHLLAQELDRELLREEEEIHFKNLQKRYGMAKDQPGYRSQGNAALRKAYNNNMTLSQLHEQQIHLLEEERTGRDCSQPVKGLIETIKQLSTSSQGVKEVKVCTTVDHYSSTPADFGFGCGFRNIQMLLSSLKHHQPFRDKLWKEGPDFIPSVPKLQELIEKAWRDGFDSTGCRQLGGILVGTRKWIGATEVAAFLSSFYIRVEIIDFHRPTGPNATHPALFEWVWNYFNCNTSFIPPLYLQHEGHSRTIVGIEKTARQQLRLIIFDPSQRRNRMIELKEGNSGLAIVRRNVNDLKKQQFQLVVVRGVIENEQEYKRCKTDFVITKVPSI